MTHMFESGNFPPYYTMNLPSRQTATYFKPDNHEVKLDYHLPAATGCLPAIVYYHGGGMTAGSRRTDPYPTWLHDHCQARGYIFISADYRLCHPTTALDQIDDAKALFKFLAGDFTRQLPQSVTLDTARIAVSGFSAGAYSARAACVYADPKPAVLLSVYGLGGDLLLDHWTGSRPPTSIAKFANLDEYPRLIADRSVISDDNIGGTGVSNRFALTVQWELQGKMLDGCFGAPGLGAKLNALDYSSREAAVPEHLKPGVLQSLVTENYPPSVFVHGTADDVVSDQESIHHHEQLVQLGVKSKLLLVKNAPHGLGDLAPVDAEMATRTAAAYKDALEFLDSVFAAV